MGSVHGTYSKISHDLPTKINKGQNFMIGTDIYFNITDMNFCGLPSIENKELVEEFHSYLAKEYTISKIIGIGKDKFAYKISSNVNKTQSTGSLRPPYPYSFFKAEIVTSGG